MLLYEVPNVLEELMVSSLVYALCTLFQFIFHAIKYFFFDGRTMTCLTEGAV